MSAAVSACSGGVSVSSEGTLATGGSSVGLAFADLSGAGVPAALAPDVVVASGKRGEVDVLTRADPTSWRVFGNFFSGGETLEVAGGRIGGAGAVVVRNADGEVALMPTQPGMSHRLGFPVSIYHFVRSGVATDSSPPATGLAVGDLDGDGSAEAVVAAPGLGLVVLPGLAAAAAPTVNPERPPTINGYKLAAGPAPSQIVITDVDGDGLADLAALDTQTPTLRIYTTATQSPLVIRAAVTVTLPATGVALRASGCAARPLVATLADGKLVAVTPGGLIDPILDEMTPVRQLASSGDALAVDSARGLSLFDSCAAAGSLLGVESVGAVALTAADATKARELAVLAPDGNSVSLYQAR